MKNIDFITQLSEIIESRKLSQPNDGSYTSELFSKGIYKIAQKVGEEGVETALAAVKQDKEEIISESADLIYHLLVLLSASGLRFDDVAAKLKERFESKQKQG